MSASLDPRHLLLIGAGPGVGAGVVRRFGREGFRSTLIARGQSLEQLASVLRGGGLEIEAVRADIGELDIDVGGAVVAAQVAAPVMRTAGSGTLLVTSGGVADQPVPALASLSMGKAALRSAATLIAAGVKEDGIHAATITIAGSVAPGTAFDPDNIAELFWTAHTDPADAWQTEYRFTGG
jgi:NAD(P)-dependent dehydrogenase (short-subunit alcohol dehydrogenase family)